MSEELNKLRESISKVARYRDSRLNEFSPELPCDWGPEKIVNPETGIPFSDDSAWYLIAEILEETRNDNLVDIRVTKLEKPKDVPALEIIYDLDPKESYLYIKVHMSASGKAFGRSFHYSDRGREV